MISAVVEIAVSLARPFTQIQASLVVSTAGVPEPSHPVVVGYTRPIVRRPPFWGRAASDGESRPAYSVRWALAGNTSPSSSPPASATIVTGEGRRRGHRQAGFTPTRQLVARAEPRLEDLVIAGQVIGTRAESGASGTVRRLLSVDSDQGCRLDEAVRAVGCNGHANRLYRPRDPSSTAADRSCRCSCRCSCGEHQVQRLPHPLGVLSILH